MFQDVKYDYTVDLTGTGDWSEFDTENYWKVVLALVFEEQYRQRFSASVSIIDLTWLRWYNDKLSPISVLTRLNVENFATATNGITSKFAVAKGIRKTVRWQPSFFQHQSGSWQFHQHRTLADNLSNRFFIGSDESTKTIAGHEFNKRTICCRLWLSLLTTNVCEQCQYVRDVASTYAKLQ